MELTKLDRNQISRAIEFNKFKKTEKISYKKQLEVLKIQKKSIGYKEFIKRKKELKLESKNNISLTKQESLKILKEIKKQGYYISNDHSIIKLENNLSKNSTKKTKDSTYTFKYKSFYWKKPFLWFKVNHIIYQANKVLKYFKWYEQNKDLSFDYKYNYEIAEIETKMTQAIVDIYDKRINYKPYDIKNKNNTSKSEIKKQISDLVTSSKKEHKKRISESYSQFKKKQINFKSFIKQWIVSYKFYRHQKINAKYIDPIYSWKKNKKYEIYVMKKDWDKSISERNSYLDKIASEIPIVRTKLSTYFSYALSFIPGAGLLYNKRYLQAFLTAFVFFPLIIIIILMGLGYISYNGVGVSGLLLGAKTLETERQPSYVLIEAVINLVFLAIGFIIYLIIVRNSWLTTKAISWGCRVRSWNTTKRFLSSEGVPYLISIPAYLLTAIIVIVPIITTILLSFTNYGSGHLYNGQTIDYTGIDNYKVLWGSEGLSTTIRKVIVWTLIWTFFSSITPMLIGFILAFVANNKNIKFKPLIRSLYILPWAVPAFITILLFSSAADSGGFISRLFMLEENQSAKDFSNTARITLILIQTWLGHSYIFLLISGTLQSIPKDFYEAAKIDGIKKSSVLFKITLPLVLVQVMPLLIGQFAFAFGNFMPIVLVTEGKPIFDPVEGVGSTDTMLSVVFKYISQSGSQKRIGLGAALSTTLSMFVIIPSAFSFIRSKSFKEAGR